MQRSDRGGERSVSLGQVFAAIGILVGLAIVVPVLGIMLVPVMAVATAVRALVRAAREMVPVQRARPPAARATATHALGASYSSP